MELLGIMVEKFVKLHHSSITICEISYRQVEIVKGYLENI
jgi:hypothetical protein